MRPRRQTTASERGAASVEQVALTALIALMLVAAISALAAAPDSEAGRRLGGDLARRIACGPRLPGPCHRHPLARAYGFELGKLVRALSPPQQVGIGPGGIPLLPVDFRYCRRASCALPGDASRGLTASLRRTTMFTVVEDRRRSDGTVRVTYWAYRPTMGWRSVTRTGGRSEIEAAQELRLRVGDVPALVPLETLAGRNHYPFRAAEEPPWRWRVESLAPG